MWSTLGNFVTNIFKFGGKAATTAAPQASKVATTAAQTAGATALLAKGIKTGAKIGAQGLVLDGIVRGTDSVIVKSADAIKLAWETNEFFKNFSIGDGAETPPSAPLFDIPKEYINIGRGALLVDSLVNPEHAKRNAAGLFVADVAQGHFNARESNDTLNYGALSEPYLILYGAALLGRA